MTDKKREKSRERSLANLIPWQPGQSANPLGHPKGVPNYKYQFSRMMLDASLEAGRRKGETAAHDIIRQIISQAGKGKPLALKMYVETVGLEKVLEYCEEFETRGEKRDRDFLHYRLHRAGSDVQQQILSTRKKYLSIMAGRRGGKSEGLRLWFADEFVNDPSSRCLYIGLTLTTAMNLLWQPMIDTLKELGIPLASHSRTDGTLTTEAGGVMKFGGNSTADEREKNRGPWWDRIAIDECQSQKQLDYLVEAILSPTLIDRAGQIAFAGTGPRVRGTYWEALFLGAYEDGRPLYPDAFRLNFSIKDNPYIPNHDQQLEEIRKEKNLKETDPLYLREYLGKLAYDDDALVLRFTDANAFTDDELAAWIRGQPVTDVRFSAGLDFGFESADALEILCYSKSRPERFVVYEWKANRTGTAQIAEECRKGIAYVQSSPLFAQVVEKSFFIHADTGGNAITPFDLATQYDLPIQTAYKQEKEMAVELLQDETRRGILKCRRGGPLWEEGRKTIYRRDEQDHLTREIDDEAFHPDALYGLLYGMRPIWLFNS